MAILIKRLSQAAAFTVVDRELVSGEERTLFQYVNLNQDRPGGPEFTAELEQLHLRLHGELADAAQIERDEQLWLEVEFEFLVLQGSGNLHQQVPTFLAEGILAWIENIKLVAAFLFGSIHGLVGMADQAAAGAYAH